MIYSNLLQLQQISFYWFNFNQRSVPRSSLFICSLILRPIVNLWFAYHLFIIWYKNNLFHPTIIIKDNAFAQHCIENSCGLRNIATFVFDSPTKITFEVVRANINILLRYLIFSICTNFKHISISMRLILANILLYNWHKFSPVKVLPSPKTHVGFYHIPHAKILNSVKVRYVTLSMCLPTQGCLHSTPPTLFKIHTYIPVL